MKFDLDIPRDADRFAQMVASLQQAGVRFAVEREQHSDGQFSRYVTIDFDVRKHR